MFIVFPVVIFISQHWLIRRKNQEQQQQQQQYIRPMEKALVSTLTLTCDLFQGTMPIKSSTRNKMKSIEEKMSENN